MAEKRGRSRGKADESEAGEHQSGTGWQTAIIEGATFGTRAVQYTVIDGLAMVEGDIVLGTAEQVEQRTEVHRQVLRGQTPFGVVVSAASRRWPSCQVPYEIDGSLPNQGRVTDAIAHWEANTQYRFVRRTPQNAAQFPDFVTFRPAGGCSSSVGRQGGQQFVNLGPNCTLGNAIHEIGHTVGLWHEQSRQDRDAFVTVHWDKIQAGMEHNFDQHITDGDDVGAYDYGSIMHYPRDAFSRDGSDTLTPVDPNADIGQRNALSAGDIAAAQSLCPTATVKEAPQDATIKEVAKDPIRDTLKEGTKDAIFDTVKERVRDTLKEITGDPKAPFDPPGGTFVEVINPFPPAPAVGGSPGALPFAVATGHQAPALGAGGDPAAALAGLDAQLQQLAQALGQADQQRAELQRQYDELAAALNAAIEAAGGLGA